MAKYKIEYTRRFIKQARLCMKRGYDMSLLERAIELLENKGVCLRVTNLISW